MFQTTSQWLSYPTQYSNSKTMNATKTQCWEATLNHSRLDQSRWLVATKMGDAWPTAVIMVWFWTCHPKKLENYFIAVSVGLHLTSPKCDCTSLEAPTSYPLHQSWLAKGTPKSSKMTLWLVVLTPLKNVKVSWDDYSQYMESHKKCSKPPTSSKWKFPQMRVPPKSSISSVHWFLQFAPAQVRTASR